MKNLIRIIDYVNQVVFPAAIAVGILLLITYNLISYGI